MLMTVTCIPYSDPRSLLDGESNIIQKLSRNTEHTHFSFCEKKRHINCYSTSFLRFNQTTRRGMTSWTATSESVTQSFNDVFSVGIRYQHAGTYVNTQWRTPLLKVTRCINRTQSMTHTYTYIQIWITQWHTYAHIIFCVEQDIESVAHTLR